MSDSIPLPDLNDIENIQQLLKSFFDGPVLAKDRLRLWADEQLTIIQKRLNYLLLLDGKPDFWDKVKNLTYLAQDDLARKAIDQINQIPKSLSHLMLTTTQDSQTFEIYILLKAAEISSGDPKKDYYVAMKIRNDQILASVYIYSQACNHISNCLNYLPHDLLKHTSFLYFGEKSLDDRIYEVAQKFYEDRVKLNLI